VSKRVFDVLVEFSVHIKLLFFEQKRMEYVINKYAFLLLFV